MCLTGDAIILPLNQTQFAQSFVTTASDEKLHHGHFLKPNQVIVPECVPINLSTYDFHACSKMRVWPEIAIITHCKQIITAITRSRRVLAIGGKH